MGCLQASRLGWLAALRTWRVIGASKDLLPVAPAQPPFSAGRPRVPPLPDADDPVWEDWTRPLRKFLKAERTWDEMLLWMRENGLSKTRFLHMLAWLSYRDLVSPWGDPKKRSLGWGPFKA